jgi:hypothetical protein
VRNRFDQLGKQIGQRALRPCGTTVAHDEISPNAQHADLRHEPVSSRTGERARLGLLGRLTSTLCLLELYGHAPGEDEVLACLGKLIAFRQKRARTSRRPRGPRQVGAPIKPFLWILSSGRPDAVLEGLGCVPAQGWPAGVYLGPPLLSLGIVVAPELPRERSTLLVRLMAGGSLLPQTVEELSTLPGHAYERAVAGPILLNLEHVLGQKPDRTHEEQEFIMAMHDSWEKAREKGLKQGLKRGLDKGHREGRAQEAAKSVLTVLRTRGIRVPKEARERILAQRDPELLHRWLKRAIRATAAAEVFQEPN